MTMVKKTKLVFVILAVLLSDKLLLANQSNNNSVDAKLVAIQNKIDQLKDKVNDQKVTETKTAPMPMVQTNPLISKMLSSGKSTYTREQLLLEGIKNNTVKNNHYYLGGKIQLTPSYDSDLINGNDYYSQTSLSSKAQLASITRISSWLTGFFSVQGQANGDLSVAAEQTYLMVNNGQTPFYLILGSKYIDFGSFARYAINISPLNRVFWISSNVSQVEGGYYSKGLNFQITAFNGSSSTNTNINQIANHAETIFYDFNLTQNASLKLGGAYLNGINQTASLANSATVELADNSRTPAFDTFANGKFKLNPDNKVSYTAEYTQTIDTSNNRDSNALLLAGMYQTSLNNKPYKLYLNYSALNALTGHYNQYLIGIGTKVLGVSMGLDYALLTASEVRNDQMVEFKFEYGF